jgi:hypothetical protein
VGFDRGGRRFQSQVDMRKPVFGDPADLLQQLTARVIGDG